VVPKIVMQHYAAEASRNPLVKGEGIVCLMLRLLLEIVSQVAVLIKVVLHFVQLAGLARDTAFLGHPAPSSVLTSLTAISTTDCKENQWRRRLTLKRGPSSSRALLRVRYPVPTQGDQPQLLSDFLQPRNIHTAPTLNSQ
jgi:hypothetical protein